MFSPTGKAQLALQYFPDSAPKEANQRLRRAINRCKPLLAALADAGYNVTAHDFTPRQIALIYEYYGEPDT